MADRRPPDAPRKAAPRSRAGVTRAALQRGAQLEQVPPQLEELRRLAQRQARLVADLAREAAAAGLQHEANETARRNRARRIEAERSTIVKREPRVEPKGKKRTIRRGG